MYSILGIRKLKSIQSVGNSASHTYRTIETKNADPARRHLNRTLIGRRSASGQEIVSEVRRRIEETGVKIRKNTVPCVELMLTASAEFFLKSDQATQKQWIDHSISWLKGQYGEKNLVHVVLHLDEKTPHLACYVVPEINGRMSARDVVGNKRKMQELVTSYAEAMEPFGLERGRLEAWAEAADVKKFYSDIQATKQQFQTELDALGVMEPPPQPKLLQSPAAREKAVAEWKGREEGKRRVLAEKAAGAALDASLARERAENLAERNEALAAENSRLRADLSAAYSALDLTKAQKDQLRKLDISRVATALCYTGIVQPKENAIDLVKRVNEFSFEQACAWLHAEMGAVPTQAIVEKLAEAKEAERPLTPAENVIKRAVQKQTEALGCDRFRLTLLPSDENAKPYLPGKPRGKDSEEKFYTRKELEAMIPWLRYQNNTGANVLITPMDDHAYYILLDDCRVDLKALQEKGFKPCIMQTTSWEKTQAVFKVPLSLPRDDVLKFFNELNSRIGDPKMTGLRHPFRLAGFRNLKPKHEREGKHPFVRLLHTSNEFCTTCIAIIKKAALRRELEEPVADKLKL